MATGQHFDVECGTGRHMGLGSWAIRVESPSLQTQIHFQIQLRIFNFSIAVAVAVSVSSAQTLARSSSGIPLAAMLHVALDSEHMPNPSNTINMSQN